ncbi:MAG TPA: type II toxin-antitoxin system VapC family toxin [Candidatus Nanoarchaeia archaeon]|nr:type II toxin-antitoxin system VapC family toxin [Candidatus Nanoarchaeia archaeon]
MKLLFDTSVLVDIDRNKSETIELLKSLVQHHELCISTITVTEILTGASLRRDAETATLKAKEILNQFAWQSVDGMTAEVAAGLFAHLIVEKKAESIEYADVLISASYFAAHCDALITHNQKDFTLLPGIQVFTPESFRRKLGK